MIKLPEGSLKKILIVKPSSLGDIVHSLPFLNSVKSAFPEAEIHWVVARGFEGILEGHPMINRLWIIDKDKWKEIRLAGKTAKELKDLFYALKDERFDLVADLQGLLRSGIITASTKSRLRIGFREAREGSTLCYTHRVQGGRDLHAVERYLKIAEFFGCDTSKVSFPLPVMDSSLKFNIQHSTFDISEPYAVLVPGARWKTKRWPVENFGKLATLLPLPSLIVGSGGDAEMASRIETSSGGKAISLAGKTSLKELVAIMSGAKFVVTNDSGPMHIAAAVGVPVFALFGPTDPVRTGPYGEGNTIIRANADCAPCFKKQCDKLRCMEGISVEKVWESIKTILNYE